MSEKRFNQTKIIEQHLAKTITVMPAGIYENFIRVRTRCFNGQELSDGDLTDLVAAGNDFGMIIRIAHYRFVDRHGYESQAFWDALIKTFTMTGSGIFTPQLDDILKSDRMKRLIKRTRFPKWVRFGLVGGSRKELAKLAAEFKSYMDGLEEDE